MTFPQFYSLMKYIAENNGPYGSNDQRPSVRYVDPVIDMRTMEVFAIDIRCSGSADVSFTTVNEFHNHPLSLEQRIREFLDARVV